MIALLLGAATAVLVLGLGARPPVRRVPGVPGPATGSRRPGEVVATMVAALVDGAGRLADRLRPARRLGRRDAQLPDALDRLASAVRAGGALGPALAEVATSTPEPLGPELRRLTDALAHGAPLTAAAVGWAQRAGASPDVRLVAAALAVGADAGGEVARAVDRVATTLRERRELRAEVRGLATQARASAGVLAVAPVAFTAFVATIEPRILTFLLTTSVGLACLVAGVALETAGALWMARITRSAV